MVFQGIADYQTYLESVALHRGSFFAAKHGKELYQRAKCWVCQSPIPPSSTMWFKTSVSGVLPRRLYRLDRILRKKSLLCRILVLTILQCYRLVNHPSKPSYKAALSPYTGWFSADASLYISLYRLDTKYSLSRLKPKVPRDWLCPWLASSGVHSMPNIIGAAADAKLLLSEKYYETLLHLEVFVEHLTLKAGLTDFRARLKACVKYLEVDSTTVYASCLARYHFLSEGGGKVRAVTPTNYFVQAVMKPFHDYFMEVLRLIPMDHSFNEAAGVEKVRRWSAEGKILSSIDMSEATDRAPRKWMRFVVAYFLGDRIADAWEGVMSIPILFGKTHQAERSFACGAPMGIYCLWPVFTLFHHAVVQLAAYKVGLPFFTGYVIRGDDVVINDPRVARVYLELLKEFGLEYSPSKTFFQVPGVAEFAKRNFVFGKDVSPISVLQLRAGARMDPFVVPQLVRRWVNLVPDFEREKITSSALSYFVRSSKASKYLEDYLTYPAHERLRSQLPEHWRIGRFERPIDLPEWMEQADQFASLRVAKLMIQDISDIMDTQIRVLSDRLGLIGKGLSLPIFTITQIYTLVDLGSELFRTPGAMGHLNEYPFRSHPLLGRYFLLTKELSDLRFENLFFDSPQFVPSRTLDIVLQLNEFGAKAMGRSRLNNRRWFVSKYAKLRSTIYFMRLRTDEKFMV